MSTRTMCNSFLRYFMQVSRLLQVRGLSVRCAPSGFSVMPSLSMTDQPPGRPMMEAPRMALASTMRRAMAVSIVWVLMQSLAVVIEKQ